MLFIVVALFFAVSSVSAAACTDYTTSTTCNAASCFWDPYASSSGRCFASLGQDNLNYPCSSWSTNNICAWHGCSWGTNPSFCYPNGMAPTQQGQETIVVRPMDVQFVGVLVTGSVQAVTIVLKTPLNNDTATPTWPVFSISNAPSNANGYLQLTNSHTCNTLSANITTSYLPPDNLPSGTTTAQLNQDLDDFIFAKHTYNFDVNIAKEAVMKQQYGPINIDINNFVNYVKHSLLDGLLTYTVKVYLGWLTGTCGTERGVSYWTDSSGSHWSFPLTYAERDFTTWRSVTQIVQINQATTGTWSYSTTTQSQIQAQ